jgi:pimeloyl-ACP methyl ester carboxylesterase
MRRVGPLAAEIISPESDRFTAPLLLVHGLWERTPMWRRSASYLAHRGWRCIAVERRAEIADLAAHVADLRAAIAALEAPPVVLGHDLGALLAMHCADSARAAVAVAPLVGTPAALQHAGSWLARRRGSALRAPRGRWRDAYPPGGATEPAALIRQILGGEPALAPPTGPAPRAVFAMQDDAVTPVAGAEAFARQCSAELHFLPSGHAAFSGPGWETTVAAVHRWIIQRLGVDLLALYEEAMQPE